MRSCADWNTGVTLDTSIRWFNETRSVWPCERRAYTSESVHIPEAGKRKDEYEFDCRKTSLYSEKDFIWRSAARKNKVDGMDVANQLQEVLVLHVKVVPMF